MTNKRNTPKCEECKQPRCIGRDGLCHECRVKLQESDAIFCDGEWCTPGGSRL